MVGDRWCRALFSYHMTIVCSSYVGYTSIVVQYSLGHGMACMLENILSMMYVYTSYVRQPQPQPQPYAELRFFRIML
jgi:hypothetical protein